MAVPVDENGFGPEDDEEGENGEEVAETDIQIARDTQVDIERDEGEHGILGDMRFE